MGEFVKFEVTDGVGLVRLERPPMNALSRQLVTELGEVATEAMTSEKVKAIVVWGGDKIFAAGADISDFPSADPSTMFSYGKLLQDVFTALAELPLVTIAAVNGFALGGGCELAMTCDFRFAAESARFGQPEILLGIIPGAGGTQRLPRLVGLARAKDIIYTGRMVRADEAHRIGLVDEVHPDAEVLDKALEAAGRFARGPLVALRAAKLSIERGMQTDIDTGLSIERASFSTLFATEDAKIGFASFFEKGPGKAEFVGR